MKLLNQCSLYSQHQHNQGHWRWENEWKVATEVHAIQQDTYSCGVFVMKVCSYNYHTILHTTYVTGSVKTLILHGFAKESVNS